MHLRPPVEMARCRLIAQLHEWINTITGLPRIQSSRYQVRGWEKWRLPWSLYVCSSGIYSMFPISLLLVLPSLSPHFFFFHLFFSLPFLPTTLSLSSPSISPHPPLLFLFPFSLLSPSRLAWLRRHPQRPPTAPC